MVMTTIPDKESSQVAGHLDLHVLRCVLPSLLQHLQLQSIFMIAMSML